MVIVASVTFSAAIHRRPVAPAMHSVGTRARDDRDLLTVHTELELVVTIDIVHPAEHDDRAPGCDVQDLELGEAVDVGAPRILDGRAVRILELLARAVESLASLI